MNPLLENRERSISLRERINQATKAIKAFVFIQFISLMRLGPDRILKKQFQQKIARGETIWLDDLSFPLPPKQKFDTDKLPLADMTPNDGKTKRKSRVMTLEAYPEPIYPITYHTPPVSGNVINGLGETEKRAAKKVFHSGNYRIAWGGLERFFHIVADDSAFSLIKKIRWQDRKRSGRPTITQYPVEDQAKMAHHTKEAGKVLGAVLVGITEIPLEYTFEGAKIGHFKSAICLATPMDLESLYDAPTLKSSIAVLEGYERVAKVAIELAERIRRLGWEARAATNLNADTSEVLHIPLAVQAGLGELGKHGSLITKELGANVRLATVLTNLPLTHDQPVDIGVDDFCTRCQICVTNCPPHAIFNLKQMVRGEEKWYVDFDKCVPYFAMNHSCGICLAVCPWTEPERGKFISKKMLAQRINKPSNS